MLCSDLQARPISQIYTDVCLKGLGVFYYSVHKLFWDQATSTLEREKAFVAPVNLSTHINIHELDALLVAFHAWALRWEKSKVIIYTDYTNAYNGLVNFTLRGPANTPRRKILLLAAQYDIVIEARWIKSSDNSLVDAFSRRTFTSIANLCPHW